MSGLTINMEKSILFGIQFGGLFCEKSGKFIQIFEDAIGLEPFKR